MAKLTSSDRASMPKSDFGLPGRKAFPMLDKNHAREALSGASRALNVGNITPDQAAKIRAKAKSILGK
jgi:hypothetical protein